MKKIKVGAFGASRGMVLMHSLTVLPEVELVAVCDRSQAVLEKIKQLGQAYGKDITVYPSFDDFLNHDMDAVILCNYASEHVPYAIRCLESGRHVMSEVPTCESIAEAIQLIETVERTGKVFTLAENFCYMDDTFEMRRRYRQGDIGEVVYAEGSYIHDWSSLYALGTGGRRNHWMNNMYSTYYSTHAINPITFITGHRPVSVSGFETQSGGHFPPSMGYRGGGAGVQMITLDNGAVLRAINGGLKREPWSDNLNFMVYGTKGCMETHAIYDHNLSVYREGDKFCEGTRENYYPKRFIADNLATRYIETGKQLSHIFSKGTIATDFHRTGDFYPGYFFMQKILGHEEGQYAVDVYSAVDCTLCGILAYRSILNGNIPMDIPDLRNSAQRDLWRNDTACTNPTAAGDQLIPAHPKGEQHIPQEVYDYVAQISKSGNPASHGYGEDRAGHAIAVNAPLN